MQIRAAVLEEFGKPLVVRDVGLDGPQAGEVLVRVQACGVCHTDMYTASGVDPSGYAPTVLGHEGAGVVEAVGEGVSSLAPGDHVLTLFSPQCRECLHCTSGKTNICLAIREQQNLGYLPDGTTRLHDGGERIRHFMGTSTFAEATVMPEIALAKVPQGGAARRALHAGLRRDDGDRRRYLHRPGRARIDVRGLRRRARRARRGGGLRAGGRRADHRRATPASSVWSRRASSARPTRCRAARAWSSRSST